MKIAVVIPVYKPFLESSEKTSLIRCLKVLSRHDIFLMSPPSLKIEEYKKLCSENNIEESHIHFINFPQQYFGSIKGYNQLMLNHEFYKAFKTFKYLLVYQLDAYIFRDDLINWCNKDYDYIGAPWIHNEWSSFYSGHLTFARSMVSKFGFKKFNLVGNGGFSLRKISSFINNLTFFKKQAALFTLNEDYFFSFFVTSYNPFFKIPAIQEALKFAFDEAPAEAYLLNNKNLPMGCHAWPKHIDFWNTYIDFNK